MEFLNAWVFGFVLLLAPLFFIKNKNLPFSEETAKKIILKGAVSKKSRFYIMCAAFVLFLFAAARPVINRGYTTIKAPVENVVIALDISREMDKTDLYPNRFEFAKTKIKKLLKLLKSQNAALILFDENTYLISPPTHDYGSLAYLLEHTKIKNIPRSETPDIQNAVAAARRLVKEPKIVVFTASENIPEDKNIYVYLCKKAANVKNAFTASYSDENLKEIAKKLKSGKEKEVRIKNRTELFEYPLVAGALLLFFALFFPLRRRS